MSQHTFNIVRDIIVEQLGVEQDEVSMNSSLIDDLGADSLDAVELIMAFEEEFGIEIQDEIAQSIKTIEDIVIYIDYAINENTMEEMDMNTSQNEPNKQSKNKKAQISNADAKFTILGMTGSGKTCYLLSMYYLMSKGIDGYTITTDDDTDVELRAKYTRLYDTSLGVDRFPIGTDNVTKYTFSLNYGHKKSMTFDWMDYPGGALMQKSRGNAEHYAEIKKSINESNCIFICIDGTLLIGDDNEEKIERLGINCGAVINSFFTDYLSEHTSLPPIIFIITKYDICRAYNNEEDLWTILLEAFNPFFVQYDTNDYRFVAMLPVALGSDIMGQENDGKLDPLNIEIPIFMGIYFASTNMKNDFKSYLEEFNKDANKIKKELEKARENELNSFFWVSRKKVNDLENDIAKQEQWIKEHNQMVKEVCDMLERQKNKLYKDYLEGICVFHNKEFKRM